MSATDTKNDADLLRRAADEMRKEMSYARIMRHHRSTLLAVAGLLDDMGAYLDWVATHHPDSDVDHAAPAIAVATAYLGSAA